MFRTIDEALEHVMGRTRTKYRKINSVETLRKVLEHFDNPQDEIAFIHIAGTNGKGSTTNYVRSILQASGLTVGTFTSPHLEVHQDRIRINNQNIDDSSLLFYLNETYRYWDEYQMHMFEIDFLVSLLYFQAQETDVVVIEAGIGGLLDTTNCITPLVAGITNVGHDHMGLLGETLQEIAFQKAGIIKQGVPVVTTETQLEVLDVIRKQAVEMDAPLTIVKPAENIEQHHEGLSFIYEGKQYQIPTKARYQVRNASLAIEIVRQLPLEISQGKIEVGLATTNFAGRFEEVQPNIFIDGAHNVPGLKAMLEATATMPKPLHIVFAALSDKETAEMLALLHQQSEDIIVTSFEFPRAKKIEQYTENFITLEANYKTAIEKGILNREKTAGTLVITGSLYFISEVYAYFSEHKERITASK